NSRSGIRLQGDKVCEASLHHDDVLQIGPFSFRVVLLPARPATHGNRTEIRLVKLDRKRRNLARLALQLRRRLQQARASFLEGERQGNHVTDSVELSHQSELLQQHLRESQQRLADLDRAERELARDREMLDQDAAELRQRMQRKEQELRERETALERERKQ